MAEAIVNTQLGATWQAFSAGTHPTGAVHPVAIQVLAEIRIEHGGASKSLEEFRDQDFDMIVTVCDSAAEECPVWLGRGRKVHLGFRDPAKAVGSEAEVLTVFRQVRDTIAALMIPLLENSASVLFPLSQTPSPAGGCERQGN